MSNSSLSHASKAGLGALGAVMLIAVLAGTALLAFLPTAARAEACPNENFRAEDNSTRLPDCRAYEMVSPPYKDAGLVESKAAGPEGTGLLLEISGGLAGLEGFTDVGFKPEAHYSISRAASGWTPVPDEPPSSEYRSAQVSGFNAFAGSSLDGQTTVWLERKLGQPENGIDIFLRRPDRSIVDVGPALPPATPPGSPEELSHADGLSMTGVSVDASHLFFELRHGFWPSDNTSEAHHVESLYEYVGTGNTTPLLVGVSDGHTVLAGKTLPAGELISHCGTVLGDPSLPAENEVSVDASTVFFTAISASTQARRGLPCNGSSPLVNEVFARIDNGEADARTVAISEPSKEDCAQCDTETGVLADADFVGASEDGSKMFFQTTQPLLGTDMSSNIYEYDFDAPAGQRIVQVSGGDSTVANPTAGALTRSVLISQDGSHAYFLATGVLTKTPNAEGESAAGGSTNLYVFERDAANPAGRTAFIARLSEADQLAWNGFTRQQRSTVQATPSGRFLVFTSNRDLTTDDTSTAPQVFEYDAQSGALVRVSIGQDGFNHDGNALAILSHNTQTLNGATLARSAGNFQAADYTPSLYGASSSVSADGSYVFFQSVVGLTPQALNQQVIGQTKVLLPGDPTEPIYAQNIYEYHDGRVSLISDGQDLTHPFETSGIKLVGTDASGGDVFFTTNDRLVGQDTDTNTDIYDARVDGGFPAPAPAPSCVGEACQGQLSGAPTLLSPGSEFQAGGNPPLAAPTAAPALRPKPKSARCIKGYVKKKSKCVKSPRAKKSAKGRK
jgi:hypothetical protein